MQILTAQSYKLEFASGSQTAEVKELCFGPIKDHEENIYDLRVKLKQKSTPLQLLGQTLFAAHSGSNLKYCIQWLNAENLLQMWKMPLILSG